MGGRGVGEVSPTTQLVHWRCFLSPAASSHRAGSSGGLEKGSMHRASNASFARKASSTGAAAWGLAPWLVKLHSPNVFPSSRSWSSLYSCYSSRGRLSSITLLCSLTSVKMVVSWQRIMRNTSMAAEASPRDL